jgi:hypothetical protein
MQNLLEPMARAPVAYHGGTARLAPAGADRLARRVEYFASSVQFVLDDPDAARRLQVLRGAMALVGGDFRYIQIVDPATGSLRLVTRAGFGLEFLDYFAVVAVQSTPLVDYAGHLIGMVSTHFRRPHRPSDRDLPDPARVREADVSVPFELWVMGRMTISFVRRAGRRGPSAQPV